MTSVFFPELSIGSEATPYIAKQVFLDNLENLLWISGLSFLLGLLVFHVFKKMNFVRCILSKAIKNKEFVFFLQPIMNVKQKKCSGMEALIRWQHPRFGTITPQYFLKELIQTKLLTKITTQLINLTAEDMNLKLKMPCYLSINIEPSMLEGKELIEAVKVYLSRSEGKHISLVLELTERGFHQFSNEQKKYLDELRELGVLFALDDFGTGKSNLSHITQIKFEYLKIDISFIAAIGNNDKAAQMLDSIIELGHKFGLTMIAEGIQTEAQRDYLLSKKVYLQQGFLFAHAMDSESVLHFIENTSLIQTQ
jgi:sensor c-di-GMP phosphodiesterase-like protein